MVKKERFLWEVVKWGQKRSVGLDSKKFNARVEGLDLALWGMVD